MKGLSLQSPRSLVNTHRNRGHQINAPTLLSGATAHTYLGQGFLGQTVVVVVMEVVMMVVMALMVVVAMGMMVVVVAGC